MRRFSASAVLPEGGILVAHPLDLPPEAKIDVSTLGRMPMTGAVRWSLMALRLYLVVMSLLVAYQVLAQV